MAAASTTTAAAAPVAAAAATFDGHVTATGGGGGGRAAGLSSTSSNIAVGAAAGAEVATAGSMGTTGSAVDGLTKQDSNSSGGSLEGASAISNIGGRSSGSGSSRMRSLLVNKSSTTMGSTGSGTGPGVLPGHVFQRRLTPKYTELMYVFDGDKNGVVWHIATEYGTRQWVNPVLSKKIEVKASSPASRYTDPKVRG
jgi:hypothetical protein